MTFYLDIETDIKTNCNGDLSNKSFDLVVRFLKYNSYSELAQIEKILDVDLTFLQNVYDESLNNLENYNSQEKLEIKNYIKNTWISTQFFISKIEAMILKVEKKPSYFRSIKYNSRIKELEDLKKEMMVIMDATMEKKRNNSQENLKLLHGYNPSQPFGEKFKEIAIKIHGTKEFKFPPQKDFDYFESGEFVKELQKLKSLIFCFENNGVKKLRFLHSCKR